MHAKKLMTILVATAILGTLVIGGAPASASSCAGKGCWSAPFAELPLFATRPPQDPAESKMIPTAASMAVLPNGRILYWNGLQDAEDLRAPMALDVGRGAGKSQSRVLDIGGQTPLWFTPSPETGGGDDMFCADNRLLPDGRAVVAGGTVWSSDPVDHEAYPDDGLNSIDPDGPGGLSELYGSKHTRMHSTAGTAPGGTWTRAGDMKHGRWYPTLVTQPDGKVFVASGVRKLLWNFDGLNVHATETLDPTSGAWTDNGPAAASSLPLFARLHLLPNGEIFYGGTGQMWNPAGETADEALWNLHKAYNPATKTWRDYLSIGSYGARSGAVEALLPLKPPYDKAEILVAGGTLGVSPGAYAANDLSEKITVGNLDDDPEWESSSERLPAMNNRRWYSSTVALPNGDVLAINGGDKDGVVLPGTEAAVREAELWDAETGEWKPLASSGRDRTYHNSAVLLPDGRVLVGGHAPLNRLYDSKGAKNDETGLTANNLKDPSFEIFSPPYLFRGNRPRIFDAANAASYGGPLPFSYDNDAANIKRVVLSRLPSVTHVADADQRTVELPFRFVGDQGVVADVPPNPAVAPPGYYYLFAIAANGAPSVAAVVRIEPGATATGVTQPVELGGSSSAKPASLRRAAASPGGIAAAGATEMPSQGTGSAATVLASLALAAVLGARLRLRRAIEHR